MPSYRPSALATELREALAGWAAVELSRFFGGDGLRLDGVQFACVLRGRVWLHADEELRGALQAEGGEGAGEPFTYAGAGGKQAQVKRSRAAARA